MELMVPLLYGIVSMVIMVYSILLILSPLLIRVFLGPIVVHLTTLSRRDIGHSIECGILYVGGFKIIGECSPIDTPL